MLDNFAFRTATPFVDVPAGTLLNIGVAPGNSASVADTLKNFEVTLANGGTYIAVANGVLNPAGFAPNPDGVSTAFTLFLQDQMRESASNPSISCGKKLYTGFLMLTVGRLDSSLVSLFL